MGEAGKARKVPLQVQGGSPDLLFRCAKLVTGGHEASVHLSSPRLLASLLKPVKEVGRPYLLQSVGVAVLLHEAPVKVTDQGGISPTLRFFFSSSSNGNREQLQDKAVMLEVGRELRFGSAQRPPAEACRRGAG